MAARDFSWAVPMMQAGYSGRSLVYLVIACFSLWSLWLGGQAEGTSSALARLETTFGGGVVLFLIFLGMVCYALWRWVDAAWDLEAYGSDGKGVVARLGMLVTGTIHLAIGVAAFTLLFTGGGSNGGSTISQWVGTVMGWPGGRWLVAAAGLLTLGAGGYYLRKAWRQDYLQHLRGNRVTTRLDPVLRFGIAAQGVVVAIIGVLILQAALSYDPQQAGGMGEAFSWLREKPYGRALVTLVCVGFLAFSLFCLVNAFYRIVPKAAGGDVETLAHRLKDKAEAAARG